MDFNKNIQKWMHNENLCRKVVKQGILAILNDHTIYFSQMFSYLVQISASSIPFAKYFPHSKWMIRDSHFICHHLGEWYRYFSCLFQQIGSLVHWSIGVSVIEAPPDTRSLPCTSNSRMNYISSLCGYILYNQTGWPSVHTSLLWFSKS